MMLTVGYPRLENRETWGTPRLGGVSTKNDGVRDMGYPPFQGLRGIHAWGGCPFSIQCWAGRSRMNKSQRIVAIVYCLLVVCCTVWVPWEMTWPKYGKVQLGYDWIWTMFAWPGPTPGEVYEKFGPHNESRRYPLAYGEPDVRSIAVKLIAVTGLCGAAFLAVGNWKSTDRKGRNDTHPD